MTVSERVERSSKPVTCPKCGAEPIARIIRGLPEFSQKLDEELSAGKIVLGGCVITDDDPEWQCTQCGQEIFRARR